MSIFKRVSSILRSQKQEPTTTSVGNPLEDARVGDIVNVDLEEYVFPVKSFILTAGLLHIAMLIIYKAAKIFSV